MYHNFFPYIRCSMSAVPTVMDYLESPPVWWYTVAADWNAESGTSVEGGRYNRAHGRFEGVDRFNEGDTYKAGTTGRSGVAFTVEEGTFQDDWVVAETGKYGLLFQNAGPNENFRATSETIDGSRIRVYVHRGPAASTVERSKESIYTYLYFNVGSSQGEYRLSFRWEEPPSLQYRSPGSSTWSTVASATGLGACSELFAKNKNRVEIDYEQEAETAFRGVTVTVAGGHSLRHSPGGNPLPNTIKVRFEGKNGWGAIEVCKPTGGTMTVKKNHITIPPGASDRTAKIVTNLRGDKNSNQNTTANVERNEQGDLSMSITVNAGTDVPKLTDVLVYIPPVWSVGLGSLYYGDLKVMTVQEVQEWDDMSRFGSSRVQIQFSNRDGAYSRWRGNMACIIDAGNGYVTARRHFGIAGGDGWNFDVVANNPDIGMVTSADCLTHKSRIPLGQEVVLDGIAAKKAVRELLQMMSVSPRFLLNIPDVGFPPYSDNFGGYILPSGTGLSARMRYMPQNSCLSVILDVVRETGMVVYDPYGRPVASIPYYLWQDVYGQVHFEPYHPLWHAPQNIYYTDYDCGSGYNNVQSFRFSSSIENLRTNVTVQGQDLWTYELLNAHVPLPQNKLLIGYYYPLIERNQRYSTLSYMNTAVLNIAAQASMETNFCEWTVPFNPLMHAGMVVLIQNNRYLGGIQPYVIIRHSATYGVNQNGQTVGVSSFIGRAVSNYLIM